MKNTKFYLNTLLVGAVFIAMAAMLTARVLCPAVVLPKIDIPNMALISLLVLLLDYYLCPHAPRCYICIPVLSALTFGLLPLFAGFACQHTFWKLGIVGGVLFTALTWLFTSMTDRIASGEKAPAAPVLSALGLYLAIQGFAGILL